MFVDAGMIEIYEKIVSAGTDGASVMRSTRDFARLDCKGVDGRAFSAFLKQDIKHDLDFWHCLCHQFNLAVNDALNSIEALKLYCVPHVRSTIYYILITICIHYKEYVTLSCSRLLE